jgi:D-alanyl-D-alanine carboxypeptidase/D-alanyl-D-alanine-endopeptidase (penicillin-binding protein 4)
MAPGWADRYIGNSVGLVQSLALRRDRSRLPARTAAGVFVSALRQRGVDARLGPRAQAPNGAPVLARVRGHSVAESIAVMLRVSESSVAEVLFRQVAISVGRPATWAGSQRAARETLTALGIDASDARLVDGSGLSREDRLTPRLLAQVLRLARVTQAKRFRAMFRADAMPVAGRSGTLTTTYGRYSTDPSRCARGLVQAKTGTILGTIALSGIADTRRGERRIFSIIVNDRPQRYSPLSTRRAVDGLAATVTGCWD